MMNFDGKRIIVTGGTRGIGFAIAQSLLALGAHVTVTGRGEAKPEELRDFEYLSVDFSDSTSRNNFLSYIENSTDLYGLVNNAGINMVNRIEDVAEEEYSEIFKVNFIAVYEAIQAFSKALLKCGNSGKIVNIASIWASHTKIGRSAYCSAKSGLLGMTRSISADLAVKDILVNAVSPGFVETELTARTMGEDGIREVSEMIPMGRLAQPEEIANVVAFLLSPSNTYLTGQNIVVDGGFTNV